MGYTLRLGPGGALDLVWFRRTVERAGASESPDGLLAALDQYRGTSLADVPLGPVLAEQRNRMEATRVAVLERYLRRRLDRGEGRSVLEITDRILAEDDRHEEVHAHLMRALAAAGRPSDALEHFHRIRRRLLDRSGAEPGPVLHAAFEQVREAHPDGEPRAQAPARTAAVSRPCPTQIPVDPHPFVGFEDLLAVGRATLRADRAGTDRPAVVAVVGGPGSGKTAFSTRLAEQVAEHFPDGQLHADLDAASLPDTLAEFLRALGETAVPESVGERVRRFRQVSAERRILVVVDGVDGPEAIASLLPGSGDCGLILASSVRPAADLRTTVLEIRRMTDDEQRALFDLRVGPQRSADEPQQVRRALDQCRGLPLAVNVLASRAVMRAHWSMRRLADRAATCGAPATVWTAGTMDLVGSVRRALALLEPAVRDDGHRLLADPVGAGRFTACDAAAVLGLPEDAAEDVCSDWSRSASPTRCRTSPETVAEPLRYRVDPLYRMGGAGRYGLRGEPRLNHFSSGATVSGRTFCHPALCPCRRAPARIGSRSPAKCRAIDSDGNDVTSAP